MLRASGLGLISFLSLFGKKDIKDVNWTYIRRSEDVQDVFWTSYVHSIYVLCLLVNLYSELKTCILHPLKGNNKGPKTKFWDPVKINPLVSLNLLSASPTKWSNTLKQFVGNSRWIVWVWPFCVVGTYRVKLISLVNLYSELKLRDLTSLQGNNKKQNEHTHSHFFSKAAGWLFRAAILY